jgi:hypothetical protein
MSDGLFDMGEESLPVEDLSPPLARDEQIAAIRSGLDSLDILSQQERQAFVESVILTTVGSLRDLTAVQARRVVDQLKVVRDRPAAKDGSLWDTRDEDTWIDRL